MKAFTLAETDSEPSDPNTFVGQARLTRMDGASKQPSTNVYRVAFDAGARTNWHSHSGPQLLQILEGVCRYQNDGGEVREAVAGDLLTVAPGERHWHGASPAGPMTHVAINIDATTNWFEPVSETDYADYGV